MEMLKRLGKALLVVLGLGIAFLLFALGISCITILWPLAIIAAIVGYVIKYVLTGEDDENIFG